MSRKYLVVLALVVLLIPVFSSAADYNDWIPYIPDELDGLKAKSKGEGMNMNSGQGSMSTFEKVYGTDNKMISVVIMHAGTGKTETWEPLEPMSMENQAMIMKTVKLQGFDAMYTYMIGTDEASIQVHLNGKATVMLSTKGGGKKGDKHYTGLLDNFDLKKIYASL